MRDKKTYFVPGISEKTKWTGELLCGMGGICQGIWRSDDRILAGLVLK